ARSSTRGGLLLVTLFICFTYRPDWDYVLALRTLLQLLQAILYQIVPAKVKLHFRVVGQFDFVYGRLYDPPVLDSVAFFLSVIDRSLPKLTLSRSKPETVDSRDRFPLPFPRYTVFCIP